MKKGWLTANLPTVCLIGDLPEEGLTSDNDSVRQYRMIDGNHKLAAIRLFMKDHHPCASTAIDADVHVGLSTDIEKHIALSELVIIWDKVYDLYKVVSFLWFILALTLAAWNLLQCCCTSRYACGV